MNFKLSRLIVLTIIIVVVSTMMIGCEHKTEMSVKTTEILDIKTTEKDEDEITKNTEPTKMTTIEKETEVVTESIIEKVAKEVTEQTKSGAEPNKENDRLAINDESTFYLNDYERQVAECIVMGESGTESYKGQILVAQCLLNACLKDSLQPSQVRKVYKYSGWNSNPSESVKNAVSEVFDNGYKVTNEYILYFYAPKYCRGKWHETQKFVTEVGGHRFFAEWGGM